MRWQVGVGAYVAFELEEDLEVEVVAESGVGGESLEENLVHRDRLLERRQVLLLDTRHRRLRLTCHRQHQHTQH